MRKIINIKELKLLVSTFLICWGGVNYVLLNFEQPMLAKCGYVLFGLFSIFSFFLSDTLSGLKKLCAVLSFLCVFLVGLVYPLDIEVIEEVYIFIPLLYVMSFPGSLKPILSSFALLSAYMSSLDAAELADIIEDGAELVVITSFSAIMAYFHKKAHTQMVVFREDSYTDYLTGLWNRKKFLETLKKCIDQVRVSPTLNFALLIVDLDGFKKVNDQQGHVVGDSALKLVSDRLNKLVNKDNAVFRIGGDEFAFVCFPQKNVESIAKNLAEEIIKTGESSYILNHKKYALTASVGIALMPEDAKDSETLCSNADLAMYKSKSTGKNNYTFYESSLSEKALRRYTLETDLKSAIKNEALSLHYQPKVCAKTSQIVSAEALIRWQHPTLGFISPVEFIPIAEQTGVIIQLGDWVIKEASKQAVKWCEVEGFEKVAVNVSAVQLCQDDFVEHVLKILESTVCDPKKIEIEQTESTLMENTKDNVKVLRQLKEHGFTLSLDDFGTAYSSLSQLSQLPIDVLKIDKSFVDHCATSDKAHMVVKTIIQLANNLNMETIAEGVEEQSQLDVLISEGCYTYQGYLFSKPLTQASFEEQLFQTVV